MGDGRLGEGREKGASEDCGNAQLDRGCPEQEPHGLCPERGQRVTKWTRAIPPI